MNAIVTGLHGTVAPALAQALAAGGHTVTAWDRAQTPIDSAAAARAFIREARPDWFFHLATGSPAWAELAAAVCAEQGVKFLFTSSVSVFAAAQRGPFTVEHPPEPADDYGRYKLDCERRVRAACPEARVVRLGWQIGLQSGGNHMVDYLERASQVQGHLDASVHWYQACSFLSDTAAGLVEVMQAQPAGLYHLDGNPGLNFHEIVLGLRRLLGRPWVVHPSTSPALDNRLLDERVRVAAITQRF